MRGFLGSFFGTSRGGQGASQVQTTTAEAPINAVKVHMKEARQFLENQQSSSSVPPDILHPDREGIEMVSTDALMNANRQIINQILDTFTDKKFIEDFDTILVEFIRRVAHWMGPLPASRSHHHTGRGGLFTHSLSVGLGALNMSASRNVTYSSAPRNKDADSLAWQLIAFIGGMLHDIGKMNTIGQVNAYAVDPDPDREGKFRSSSAPYYSTAWEPTVQGFAGWADTYRVRSYYIDYDGRDVFPAEDYTQRYVLALVPRPFLAYIYYSNPVIRQQFEDFIRNPGSAAKTPIFEVVQDADHINVAQALDPRRKPGSVELHALIMRRFAEFAAEMPWNLPTSPFIYAYVQHRTKESRRYYGLPFFVVTETSVEQLENYILSRPTLGVGLTSKNITEMIFNALEKSAIMNRTVDTLLPLQSTPAGMADYIPASRATVRFSAREASSHVITSNKPEDVILSQNVVSISVRYDARVTMDAPVLSFHNTPEDKSGAVLHSAVEAGNLEPADKGLRNDPGYMAEFKKGARETPIDFSDLNLDKKLEEELHKIQPAPAIRQSEKEKSEPAAKQNKLADLKKISSSGELGLRPPFVDPSGPAWARLFADLSKLSETPDASAMHTAWAGIWLYLRDNPHSSATAVTMSSGHYAIRCLSLGLGLRDTLFTALNDVGLQGKMLAFYWQREKITTDHARFEQLFELTKDVDGKQLFRLKAEACAAIEEVLHEEGQGAKA